MTAHRDALRLRATRPRGHSATPSQIHIPSLVFSRTARLIPQTCDGTGGRQQSAVNVTLVLTRVN